MRSIGPQPLSRMGFTTPVNANEALSNGGLDAYWQLQHQDRVEKSNQLLHPKIKRNRNRNKRKIILLSLHKSNTTELAFKLVIKGCKGFLTS